MYIFRRLVPLLLAASLLTASAWGDVFVKNRPFKGRTSGKGAALMVEAVPMLDALGVQGYKLEPTGLLVAGKTVPLEGSLVNLKALTDALGAKMVVNASMGTVDVYQGAEAGTGAQSAGAAEKKLQPAAASWGAGTWHTTWDAAAAEAKRSNKPILINFTGSDWCGWCMRLKEEVFDTDIFRGWASQRVVLLEVDFPKRKAQPEPMKAANQQLAQKFGVRGYPTICFANAKGDTLGNFGYMEGGPTVWTKEAEKYMKKR